MSAPTEGGPRGVGRRIRGLPKGNEKRSFAPVPKPVKNVKHCCDSPKYEYSDNSKVCINCGTQISESNIVAEVTFGETSTGAATVQGGYVGENARYAKNVGVAASRRIGGQYQSREETEMNGRRELRLLCPQLHVASGTEDVALNLWKLAAMQNFIQGRRTQEVAGVCLYAACRRDKHNTVLLMDISDALHVNVFRLGDIYKELNKLLFLEVHSHIQPIVEVEPLLYKYASQLEFGEQTRQVAEDAARIVKRMKRDWMVTGRHPAGLCGACIILAARMNNFRRTVREVVYVVKVADMTIASRLAEFKRTRSSIMTVNDFRSKAMRLKHQHDPPSVDAAAQRQKKLLDTIRKREERKQSRLSVDLTDGDSVASPRSTRSTSAAASATASPTPEPLSDRLSSKRRKTRENTASSNASTPRLDADGFAVPSIPKKKPPGQTKAAAKVVPLTDSDFAKENELQDEIEEILQDPECVSSRDNIEREKLESRARDVAAQQRAALTAQEQAAGRQRPSISDSIEIGEDEFADDPEVQNALLSDDQVRVKEKIWVAHNEDWLRAQQAKQLKRALDEAEGRSGSDRKNHGGGGKRKRSRIGDGSVLTEGGTPVASPLDAATRMLEKRAPKTWSKSIDYAALNRVMGEKASAESTPAASRAASVARSVEGSVPPSPRPDSASEPQALSRPSAPVAPMLASTSNVPPPDVQHAVVQGLAEAAEKASRRADRVATEAVAGGDETTTIRTGDGNGEKKGQDHDDDDTHDPNDYNDPNDHRNDNVDDEDDDDDDDDEPDENQDFDDAMEDMEGDFGVGEYNDDVGYGYDDDGGDEFE